MSLQQMGSSPHTRGALPTERGRHLRRRIIPAYAGSTTTLVPGTMADEGSSPHTRGAPGRRLALVLGVGIIPAYAGSTAGCSGMSGQATDHPRIRGEHPGVNRNGRGPAGSSPHTRGARKFPGGFFSFRGIIPAYAGSTLFSRDAIHHTRDHPRIRGEHPPGPATNCPCPGSSPHTRGAPSRAWPPRRPGGIIPAYAGSTLSLGGFPPRCTDHPRIRGEHSTSAEALLMKVGSSPHTRGAPPQRHHRRSEGRIIPAYAGSTVSLLVSHFRPSDHPRIRGEHSHAGTCSYGIGGSSPHTRGARPAPSASAPPLRIIPAYAGSTPSPSSKPHGKADHPRIRGEHTRSHAQKGWGGGSSPHTRGARRPSGRGSGRRRIIPAYAGSTLLVAAMNLLGADHPRIRGEHVQCVVCDPGRLGSSPHTRGAPLAFIHEVVRGRIIPAYAGSTSTLQRTRQRLGDHPRIRGEHSWKSLQYQGSPP